MKLRTIIAGALFASAVIAIAGAPSTASASEGEPAPVVLAYVEGSWTLSAPAGASEVKLIDPAPQEIMCGENYGSECGGLFTFASQADCITVQLDWMHGPYVSSDPTACREEEPTEEPPVYVPPVLDCQPGTVPGWLNEHGDPTACVNDDPLPTEPPVTPQEPVEPPVVIESPAATPEPVTADVAPVAAESAPVVDVRPQLAETGVGEHVLGVLIGAAIVIPIGWFLGWGQNLIRGRYRRQTERLKGRK